MADPNLAEISERLRVLVGQAGALVQDIDHVVDELQDRVERLDDEKDRDVERG